MASFRKNPNKIREGKTGYTLLIYAVVALLCFLCVYPMYYVLIMSFSSPENAAQMNVYLFPEGFSLDAYKVLVQDPELWRAYLNTIIYVVNMRIVLISIFIVSCANTTF